MRPIYVFYHFFAIPGYDWTWVLDQQLKDIRDSGLSEVAKVNMCITGEIDLNYLDIRYPFVNVIDQRSIDDPNIFEGQTLRAIHQADLPDDAYVLYIHNKGATSNSTYVASWRETLNYEMITKWRHCIGSLAMYDVDVVGVSDTHVLRSNRVITSGNFWWAQAKYLKTLPDPIDSTKYLDKHHPSDHDYRYCFERWITSNNPWMFFSCDMNVDPYIEYYFVEDYIKGIKNE
jgi:hypothetical protein